MRRAVLILVPIFLIASACSLGPREDWAEAIRDAHEEAIERRSAKVRLGVDVEVIETNIRQTPEALISRLEGDVDFSSVRARLVGDGPQKPVVLFDDLVVYLPRSAASVGTGGRPWARFDFEREPSVDIDGTDRRLAVGAGFISPAVATELVEGVLTGSVERVGSKSKGGVQTTHYTARLSQDAAAREIDDEDRREGMLRLFDTLGVQDDVFPVDVWIDADGLIRGVRFTLRQQKDRVNAFRTRIDWEFYEYGAGGDVAMPSNSESVEKRRFREFIVDFIRETV